MLSMHNVPYALKHIRHILPQKESGSNKVSCSPSAFICRSHLLYDPDLFHKKAGTSAS